MAKKIDYPIIKKMIWEGGRVFVLAFAATVWAQIEAGAGTTDPKTWLRSVALAAGAAGIKALSKWARDKWGKDNYSSWIYKLSL